ncbi:MAG: dockerin type I repeat-containing protein [Acidobacteriota bacterium]
MTRCASVALALLSLISTASAMPQLALGDVSCQPGAELAVPLSLSGDPVAQLLVSIELESSLAEPVDVRESGELLASGVSLDWALTAPGRLTILIHDQRRQALPEQLGDLILRLADEVPADTELELRVEELQLIGPDSSELAGLARDATITIGECRPGDVHPPSAGDARVDLADLLFARQLVLGERGASERDLCGDLAPGLGEGQGWQVVGDGRLDADDLPLLRRASAGLLELGCGALPVPSTGSAARLHRHPGDIAPDASGDGRVNIADVVTLLRFSVGLQVPSQEQLLRADIAPNRTLDGLTIVDGDGSLDIADVVAALRAAVDLITLAWPEREISVAWEEGGELVAHQAVIAGWPSWAEPRLPPGECDGLGEGLDWSVGGDRLAMTCLPGPIEGPTTFGHLRYRAIESIDLTSLSLSVLALDSDLIRRRPGTSLRAEEGATP